jgi:hypothetical protein
MKRAGLQEKSSLEVEGSVEYNGAMKGGGDATLWNLSTEVAVDSDAHNS